MSNVVVYIVCHDSRHGNVYYAFFKHKNADKKYQQLIREELIANGFEPTNDAIEFYQEHLPSDYFWFEEVLIEDVEEVFYEALNRRD